MQPISSIDASTSEVGCTCADFRTRYIRRAVVGAGARSWCGKERAKGRAAIARNAFALRVGTKLTERLLEHLNQVPARVRKDCNLKQS